MGEASVHRGCITVCYIYRAAQQDAWRSKRGVAFASNDQPKCFDRMQLGIQLLHIRLLYQPNADDTSRMHKCTSFTRSSCVARRFECGF